MMFLLYWLWVALSQDRPSLPINSIVDIVDSYANIVYLVSYCNNKYLRALHVLSFTSCGQCLVLALAAYLCAGQCFLKKNLL